MMGRRRLRKRERGVAQQIVEGGPRSGQFDAFVKRIDRRPQGRPLKRAAAVSQFRCRTEKGSRCMSLDSHLSELERRHRAIEHAIAAENMHPACDDLKLIELKRKKLSLKDEIEKLRQEKVLATAH
jgi:hypothetical protein